MRRGWRGLVQGFALAGACFGAMPHWATAQDGGLTLEAAFANPTDRYGHGALGTPGEFGEWASLRVTLTKRSKSGGPVSGQWSKTFSLDLPEDLVFEDTAPRLWDVDGDGTTEIAVVQSHETQGSRFVVFSIDAKGTTSIRGETPFSGQRHRWIAPVGMSDIDRDGQMEIAVIEQPHLNKNLVIYRVTSSGLTEIFRANGQFTNHRLGSPDILGGVYDCGKGRAFVVASANWAKVVGISYDEKTNAYTAREAKTPPTQDGFAEALSCD